jgi:signal transduction histidine kinase
VKASGAAGLEITIDAPERLPSLPAAVEVAAYRIVQEALTNVVRHARARAICVRLSLNGALQVEVTDDGDGLPTPRHAGIGLLSMRERAEELGGTCLVERQSAGGTRVLAHLPLLVSAGDMRRDSQRVVNNGAAEAENRHRVSASRA